MSQITCCPNCSTTFRVTDAQLAAHQGKVRCGRCAFVFHAPDFIQALISETPIAQSIPDTPEAPAIPEPITEPILGTTNVTPLAPADVFSNDNEGITSEPLSNNNYEAIPTNTLKNDPQTLAQLAAEEIELDAALAKALFEEVDHPTAATEHPPIEIDSDSEYQPILSDDDLFTPAKTHSRFSYLWIIGCVLALLVLVAQLGFVFRQQLSQEFPALRPKYLALCAHLQCTLPLPREAQLLRSEYSELTFIPNNPKLIQLNATLRNLAAFEQELPKLELTLTDENEKVIVRKIFTAQQYLLQNERVQNSIEANEEVHAFLQLDLGELHSTGYSLHWFY